MGQASQILILNMFYCFCLLRPLWGKQIDPTLWDPPKQKQKRKQNLTKQTNKYQTNNQTNKHPKTKQNQIQIGKGILKVWGTEHPNIGE